MLRMFSWNGGRGKGRRIFSLIDWWSWVLMITGEVWAVWRRNRLKCVVFVLGVFSLCMFGLAPVEGVWLKWVAKWRAMKELAWAGDLSWALSEYGDFLGFNGGVWVLIYGLAMLRRSRFLRLLIVGSFLGTVMTGGVANVLRPLAGRARPNAKVEPGFYGPQLAAKFHSFPSGHTATAFGGAIPVMVAEPRLGWPLMVMATAIAGSRLYNRAHHPSDVLFSIAMAIVIGVPIGLGVRRLRRRQEQQQAGRPPPN
jgi:membrane-associated phospholipid phosphatase